MSTEAIGAIAWLKRLRGKREGSGSSGHGQMKMLRQLPRLLRFIPGTAQDVRCYFLTLQYWLSGSTDNIANMTRLLIGKYADGPRRGLRSVVKAKAPIVYPDVGLYHPRLKQPIVERLDQLPSSGPGTCGTVGLLLMRSYLLADNSRHYDGVIAALEARGLRVVPAFASGLNSRPAIEKYFLHNGRSTIDALLSLTGFSLVGGPAYNDAKAAEDILATLDVPYLSALPTRVSDTRGMAVLRARADAGGKHHHGGNPRTRWRHSPTVFGGRSHVLKQRWKGREIVLGPKAGLNMQVCQERASFLASRVARLVAVRRTARPDGTIVLFNFPPNAGNVGTAAFLAVFESLHQTLAAMKAAGYTVEVPPSVDALRERIIDGNARRFGAHANVHARVSAGDHVRDETWLAEIEAQWGPAPGRQQSDGSSIFVLGERFGNVFVGIQPAFGYEGDPMRLLFERGFAPTHAFSAFYRWLRKDFGAHSVLHFGTHGALEFMPGKQVGMSGGCWSDRLIGDLPNFYLYASNNPSEGTIAKRRSNATLISYLTPPIAHAGLYRGLLDLKASIDRWRQLDPNAGTERQELAVLIQSQAAAVDLGAAEPVWGTGSGSADRGARSAGFGTRIYADSARPARGRRAAFGA